MVRKLINEWSQVPSANNFAAGDGGWPEGMSRSDVNNAARANMAAMRSHYNNPEYIDVVRQGPLPSDVGTFTRISDTQFTISFPLFDLRVFFSVGRFIKFTGGGETGVTQVAAVSYDGSGVTTVDVNPFFVIHAGATQVFVHAMESLRALAFLDASEEFFIPPTPDSAGINSAIAQATAAGGGTVFLASEDYTIDSVILLDFAQNKIRILGSGPNTSLTQAAGANLDQMIDIRPGTTNIIENVVLNANDTNQTSGAARCIRVDSGFDSTLINVQMILCKVGVFITSGFMQSLNIERCFFSNFREFGIQSETSGSDHKGRISDSHFNGSSVAVLDPAAIKVSGRWKITGNEIVSIQSATFTPRGIWLMNLTSPSTGALRSIVSGNVVLCGTGNNVAIEVGASDVVVDGNVIDLESSNGVGIDVRSNAAGQYARRGVISSNQIAGGTPIRTNQLCENLMISGNNVEAATNGMVLGCRQSVIQANRVRAGVNGIDILGSGIATLVRGNRLDTQTGSAITVRNLATNCEVSENSIVGTPSIGIDLEEVALVKGNSVRDSLAAIRIAATKNGCKVTGNDTSGSANDVDDSSDYRFSTGNSHDVNGVHIRKSVGFSPAPLALPPRRGKYIATVTLKVTATSQNTSSEIFVRVGQDANVTDPLVGQLTAATEVGKDQGSETLSMEFYVNNNDESLTFTETLTGAANTTVTISVIYVGEEQ